MPELPEVETICRGLAPHLVGRRIVRVQLRREGLRYPFPAGLASHLEGCAITSVARRAKYLLFYLDSGDVLIAHLGMSGTMVLYPVKDHLARTHDHVLLDVDHSGFEGGLRLAFHDPRRFGVLDCCSSEALPHHHLLAHLGPEPLERDFTSAYLRRALAGRRQPVKQALMDAKLVVGVGNIYASEALFQACIHPLAPAGSLTKAACDRLVKAVQEVLTQAIASGGSTLRDYVRSSGDAGYFQHSFAVYGRQSEPCCRCHTPIQKIVTGGRVTYFCNKCQRVK